MASDPDTDVISISSGSEDDGPGEVSRSDGGGEDTSARALDDHSRTQLHVAIATAPEHRVREAFAALADSVPEIPERVFRMLVASRLQHADAARAPHAGRTVLVPRWMICENCKEEYDAGTERKHGECRYHSGALRSLSTWHGSRPHSVCDRVSGDLEADEDAFVDWDENCHGPIDCDENREEYPENFTWSCCDLDGRSEGCEKAEHQPEQEQGRRKRARY